MNELHVDRESGHLLVENRVLRRGDYIDLQINDAWQRVRVRVSMLGPRQMEPSLSANPEQRAALFV